MLGGIIYRGDDTKTVKQLTNYFTLQKLKRSHLLYSE